MTTISSQRYLDEAIVARKVSEQDFTASYVTVDIEGVSYDVVVDGHHSIAAAKRTGSDVSWEHSEAMQQDADAMGWEWFLQQAYMDSDWYNIETGMNVWQ